jgi:hypothetical protein
MAIAGLSVWVLFIMLLLDWFVLPRPLNFIAPQSAEDKADVFYTLFPLGPLKPILRLIPIPGQLAEMATTARAWATRRWLRQGLFGPPWSMTCFVVRIQYNEVSSGGRLLIRLEGRIGSRSLVIKQLGRLWAEEVGDGPPHEAWGFDNFLA